MKVTKYRDCFKVFLSLKPMLFYEEPDSACCTRLQSLASVNVLNDAFDRAVVYTCDGSSRNAMW